MVTYEVCKVRSLSFVTTSLRRNPQQTRDRILAAALQEFSTRGLSGARVDTIARRARINKRILYHYFGNKRNLYHEIVRLKLTEKEKLKWNDPDAPSEGLSAWYAIASDDPVWIRIMQWEALERGDGDLVGERRARMQTICAALRARQKQGRLAGDLDTELLLILMVGLSVTPTAFPQVVRLVTGGPASAPSFQRRWRAFLNRFAERLLPCSSPE